MNVDHIVAVVGLNGAGKGLVAARLACSTWAAGGTVVANIGLFPERAGYPGAGAMQLRRWRDLPKLGVIRCTPGDDCDEHDLPTSHPEWSLTGGRPVLLWLDEIQAVFPARSFAALPPELVRVINQLRKQQVQVVWTTPAWEQGDVELRRVTRQVIECKSFLKDPWDRVPGELGWFPKVKRRDGRRVRARGVWSPRRLFRFRAFDAVDYELSKGAAALSDQLARRIKPQWTSWYWRPRHRHQLAYSSDAQVQLLDHLDQTGVCVNCDGTRARKKCTCDGGRADRPGAVASLPHHQAQSLNGGSRL